METVKTLDSLSFDSLFTAFSEAFIDYELQLSSDELAVMLSRRGFVPSLSFGLFADGRLVSFTLNGIGVFNGEKTAYDTGTGTIKEFRGRGYASRIFTESLPSLRQAGVTQYLLEVLQHNTRAVSVYEKLGFMVSREFNYYTQQCSLVKLPSGKLPSDYRVCEVDVKQINEFGRFGDFAPSWQNTSEAVLRRKDDFKVFGAFRGDELVGYCIFEPGSGDVTQIAVSREHRRKGLATAMLAMALECNRHQSVKVINTEVSCDSITAFLDACGLPVRGKQFEMIRRL